MRTIAAALALLMLTWMPGTASADDTLHVVAAFPGV